jgi:hypothetical protein
MYPSLASSLSRAAAVESDRESREGSPPRFLVLELQLFTIPLRISYFGVLSS